MRALLAAALLGLLRACSGTLIVCDAGSTGTRLYIYDVDASGALVGKSMDKVRPGLSTFGEKPEEATAYLLPLFEHAFAELGGGGGDAEAAKRAREVPVYIFATAGMRLIPAEQQQRVWDAVYDGLRGAGESRFPFALERQNLATIPGEAEGFYAALASNLLAGRIDATGRPLCRDEGTELLGALDLGGSSTQVVFPLESSKCEAKKGLLRATPLRPLARGDFWVYSYLGYGAEKIKQRHWDLLGEGADPCLPAGFSREGKAGEGDGAQCRERLGEALWGASARACELAPGSDSCAIDGVVVPPGAADAEYVAMSVYFFALDCVRQLGEESIGEWPSPSVGDVQRAGDAFCAVPWARQQEEWVVGEGTKHAFTDAGQLPEICLRANYALLLLRFVYGVSEDEHQFTVAFEIAGEEVEWTRGAAVSILSGVHGASLKANGPVAPPPSRHVFMGLAMVALGVLFVMRGWPRRKKTMMADIAKLRSTEE